MSHTPPLVEALWWFIENVAVDDPERTDHFFALRERYRNEYQVNVGAAFLVVQQGGSSSEVYIHVSESEEMAQEFKDDCEKGAYHTSEILPVPKEVAVLGEAAYSFIEEVVQAAFELP